MHSCRVAPTVACVDWFNTDARELPRSVTDNVTVLFALPLLRPRFNHFLIGLKILLLLKYGSILPRICKHISPVLYSNISEIVNNLFKQRLRHNRSSFIVIIKQPLLFSCLTHPLFLLTIFDTVLSTKFCCLEGFVSLKNSRSQEHSQCIRVIASFPITEI